MSDPAKQNPFDLLLESIRVVVAEEVAKALSGNGRATDEPDRWLTPEEAAKLMQVNEAWLYRHARGLPFAKKLSRKALRFSERGLMRWMAARK
jgi:predicted DNA-binding transcriptional regulator AlpA